MARHLILERYHWFDGEIRRGRYPNAVSLAKRFELSRKTAKRDIAFLRDRLGAPLEYDPARRGYYYSDKSFRLPPLFATERQLLTLLMARHLLKSGGGRLDDELKNFAETLFATVADRRFSAGELDCLFSAAFPDSSPAKADLFQSVLAALTERRLLEITYISPRLGEKTQRTVEPHHLQYYQGSWVLLAWCRQAKDWRKFFVSRMEEARIPAETFPPKPQELWKPHLEGAYGIFQGDKAIRVRLLFCAERARWIKLQAWHEKQKMISHEDGRLELCLDVADLREIRLKVLQYGAEVEVLEPRELKESIRQEIKKMADLYGLTVKDDEQLMMPSSCP
jgi:predicted DNA-binding transcriptional regulator YafY